MVAVVAAVVVVVEHDAEPVIGRKIVLLYSEIKVEASVESLMAVEMVEIEFVLAEHERFPEVEQADDCIDVVLKRVPQQK